jgi:hypothetical protein
MPVAPATLEAEIRRTQFKAIPDKIMRPYSKTNQPTKHTKGWGGEQSSNPNTTTTTPKKHTLQERI